MSLNICTRLTLHKDHLGPWSDEHVCSEVNLTEFNGIHSLVRMLSIAAKAT